MKDAEHQMVKIDETQEAIARIRMTIDNDKQARERLQAESDDNNREVQDTAEALCDSCQWTFGSPQGSKINARILAAKFPGAEDDYGHFDKEIRAFIAENIPLEALRYEEDIYVGTFP
ncbi:hypothetical protein NLJ89_g6682 [Agrocybe chaxingu]|uniref:Uncharacterized protein n=1 Tax=Agrocybe chaxingu TaxID=84603 RepID=A0A9W8JYA4_9AGAR|nr:hypothetical protein NLJ89_g6682 [Agrocybe chaxingu]